MVAPDLKRSFDMKKFVLAIWALAGMAVLLNACGGSSTASSSAWEPYLVMKAPHAPAVMEVAEAAAERIFRRHANPFQIMSQALAATPACPGIGTVAPASASDLYYKVSSCTGVLYHLLPCPTSADTCVIGGLDTGQAVLFDQLGCTGNAFVSTSFNAGSSTQSISGVAITPGTLFRYDPTSAGATDASTYLLLPPAEAPQQTPILSIYGYDGRGCQPANFPAGTMLTAYKLEVNDPNVSGMASTSFPGPGVVGTP
jgi:hypothetical protein